MTDIIDAIRTSISGARPRLVTAPEILSALAEPDRGDADKALFFENSAAGPGFYTGGSITTSSMATNIARRSKAIGQG